MGLMIEDGKGTGKTVGVNEENRILAHCISQSEFAHINQHEGDVYHALFDKDPDANDDCIVYVKNTSDKDMLINGVMMAISGACEVTWKLGVSGTPIDGSDITPANMNAGSGKLATGTFQQGTDITGLSGGNDIFKFKFTAALRSTSFQPDANIILPKNSTFAIYVDTAGVVVEGHIGFAYHN